MHALLRAAILKWDKALGTLEPSKRADLVVIAGKVGDPYEALIQAKETSIRQVMINGVARYGMPDLMRALGAEGQALRVGGETRRLFLEQTTADPDVAHVLLRAAAAPLSTILEPITPDSLTVADDPDFLTVIVHQPNVPDPIRTGLAQLY